MTLSTFAEVQEHFAELFGRAAALYNLNPLLGRLYGYLFLAPEPMTLEELSQTVGSAKSTVSVAMRSLERYRVVRRQWIKGDRRDFFEARTDTTEILQELFNLFFSPELKYMRDANSTARQALAGTLSETHGLTATQRQELLTRVETMDDFLSMVSTMLSQLLKPESGPTNHAQRIEIEVEE